ncbi:MAG TPA: hypothetical protein VIK55_20350 [Paludibacter sp.]
MFFIDKNDPIYSALGNRLVSRFVESCWQPYAGSYINLYFDDFRRGGGMFKLTGCQQHNLCCYCMRLVKETNRTLEHVVPKSVNDDDVLRRYQYSGLVSPYIFILKNKNVHFHTPPFPHIIAYQNLVLSCDGDIFGNGIVHCCNKFRGNKDIIPIMFDSSVGQMVNYAKDGTMIYSEALNSTVLNLGLEYQTLVLIRKMWYTLSVQFSVDEISMARADRSKFVELLEIMEGMPSELKQTFSNQTYWNLLFEYYWFYEYYRGDN